MVNRTRKKPKNNKKPRSNKSPPLPERFKNTTKPKNINQFERIGAKTRDTRKQLTNVTKVVTQNIRKNEPGLLSVKFEVLNPANGKLETFTGMSSYGFPKNKENFERMYQQAENHAKFQFIEKFKKPFGGSRALLLLPKRHEYIYFDLLTRAKIERAERNYQQDLRLRARASK